MAEEGEGDKITLTDIAGKTPTPAQLEKLQAKLYQQDQENAKLKKQLDEALAEKRKPGITSIDEEGKAERKKRPNSWGLSDLVLPPYTKKRVAIYKICDGDEGLNPATGLPVEPFDVLVTGRYTFYDKFEKDPMKKDKIIQNIIGTKRSVVDGKPILEEDIDDVLFTKGWLQVSVEEEYPLYVFLELHPHNKTNRFRPNNAPKVFERMDINIQSRASQGAALDLTLDAGNSVKKMSKEELFNYASQVVEINSSAGRPIHEIRTDLMRWAMSNPIPYFKLNKNERAGVQITVLDALAFGLIEYRASEKSYINLETDEKIATHTASEEPMDRLVKVLASDEGKEIYQNLQERMNYWGND
jgi:hypothetical protein